MKTWWRRILLLVLVLVVAVATAYVIFALVAAKRRQLALQRVEKPAVMLAYEQLNKDIAKAEATGQPVVITARHDSWSPEPMATIEGYARLFDSPESDFKNDAVWQEFRKLDVPAAELSDSQREKLGQLLESKRDLLEGIRQMAPARGPVCPLDFSRGPAMSLRHLAKMVSFARLLSRNALMEADEGDVDSAVDDLFTAMKLGDVLAGEPIFMSHLVRFAIYDTVHYGIRDAFPPGEFPAERLESLLAHLAQADNHEAYVEGLTAEFAFGVGQYEMLRTGEYAHDPETHMLGGQEWLLALYSNPLARPWLFNEEAAYVDIASRVIEACASPFHEVTETLTGLGEDIDATPRVYVLLRLLFVTPRSTGGAQARHEATVDLIQMGLLLEDYRVEHGVYPNSVDAIAERLGGTVPVDPFTGDSYVYKPLDDSFLLYSLGLNGLDDGGIHAHFEGDLVWRGRKVEG